ncbi:MAG: hypothetical protein PHE06_13095, partial [Lachnospiraceae bacterium]|nr:hypothetical protein [Lachnospiraceae bacterium]
ISGLRKDTETRRKQALGYYGTDTSEAAPGDQGRLSVSSVELVNHEVLELKWNFKSTQEDATGLSDYDISLFENREEAVYPRAKISIKSGSGDAGTGGQITQRNPETGNTVKAQVTFYDVSSGSQIGEPVDLNFDCYMEYDDTTGITSGHLILDAVDLELTNQTMASLGITEKNAEETVVRKTSDALLAELYGKTVEEDAAGTAGTEGMELLKKSYSIRRLGLDCETDIYATIKASNPSYRESREKTSNTENPYFDSISSEENSVPGQTPSVSDEVHIANARHLWNAAFEEEAQAVASGTEDPQTEVSRTMQYVQTDDLAWYTADTAAEGTAQENAGLLNGGYTYYEEESSGNHIPKSIAADADTGDASLAFHGFEILHSETIYDGSYNGKNKTITGLIFHKDSLPSPEDPTSDVSMLGMIRNNEGVVQNLTLKDTLVYGASKQEQNQEGGTGTEGTGTGTEKTGTGSEVYQSGIDYVGAVCGKLSGGQLIKCKVTGGTVLGRMYVGGLAGGIDLSVPPVSGNGTRGELSKAAVSEGSNEAKVSGWAYVGGIAGGIQELTDPDTNLYVAAIAENNFSYNVIEKSTNLGPARGLEFSPEGITGTEAGDVPDSSSCIGGIIGLSQYMKLTECISSPKPTEAEQTAIDNLKGTEEDAQIFSLYGNFVGGIAGYSCNLTEIDRCSTGEGYVTGQNFVGGIVGYHDGKANGTFKTLQGGSSGNQASVIGENFVGGISGANADLNSDDNRLYNELTYSGDWIDTLAADAVAGQDTANSPTILNWSNSGVVVASGKYAGGIAGFNTGVLRACTCEVNTANTSLTNQYRRIASAQGGGASQYVGGLAGYNNGIIDYRTGASDTGIGRVVSVVTGGDFVGGIAGYNDVKGSWSNYVLDGGYIEGTNFVGGIAGVNYSEAVFSASAMLTSNPNEITGNYYVGGVMGANFAVVDKEASLQLGCTVNNFLGEINQNTRTADDSGVDGAFTGGFIGANMLLQKTETVGSGEGKQTAEAFSGTLSQTILDTLNDEKTSLDQKTEKLTALMNEKQISEGFTSYNATDKMMQIAGTEDAWLSSHLKGITGGVYVGGIMGFNSSQTRLELAYIENQTRVEAVKTIIDEDRWKLYDQDTANMETAAAEAGTLTAYQVNYGYSFAGGIIGLVSAHTIVDHCGNVQQGSVVTKGTYRGNIAEINENIISNCVTGSIGILGVSYTGGIAGINGKVVTTSDNGVEETKYARIQGCTVDGIIRGASYIGGIAAKNYGTIEEYSVDTEQKTPNTFSGTVSGTGNDIGGIAGKNYEGASIKNVKITSSAVVGVAGTRVGGVIGENQSKISNITDISSETGAVISGTADVGGIIGYQMQTANQDLRSAISSVLLLDASAGAQLENRATVTATRGNAGGIVGTADSVLNLENCWNYGKVEAQLSGNAGGITAELLAENSVINNSINLADVISRNGKAGGIAAVNNGSISDCQVGDSSQSLISVTAQTNTGGFCAENNGTIEYGILQNITVSSSAQSGISYTGGFAGINNGTIEDCSTSDGRTAGPAEVTVRMQSDGSAIGGIAGINYGTIGKVTLDTDGKDVTENTDIYGITLDVYGHQGNTGGIAGINEARAFIQHVNFTMDSAVNFLGGAGIGYGGIAGTNGGTIQDCISKAKMSLVGDANAIPSMGGIAGINREDAVIQRVQIRAGTNLKCTMGYSYLGGIAGMNLGEISDSDNSVDALSPNDQVVDFSADYYNRNRSSYYKSKDPENALSETNRPDPESMVYIINYQGQTGGIAGVMGNPQNKEEGYTSSIHEVKTGKNWYVTMTNQANDNACGGLIGYSYSIETISNVTNYAAVCRKYESI